MLRLLGIIIVTGILAVFLRPDTTNPLHFSEEYPEALPGPFTGGFGEESCHSCHFDYPLNPEKGSLTIEGLPEQYQGGKSYTINISVNRDDLGQAGFQLSSRFKDGKQAGSFKINSERLSFTEVKNNIQYLQHSLKGSKIHNQPTAHWEATWVAPDSGSEKIIFNIAANAGNGDASAFEDYIYTREIKIEALEN